MDKKKKIDFPLLNKNLSVVKDEKPGKSFIHVSVFPKPKTSKKSFSDNKPDKFTKDQIDKNDKKKGNLKRIKALCLKQESTNNELFYRLSEPTYFEKDLYHNSPSHFELFRIKTLSFTIKEGNSKVLIHFEAGLLYEKYHIDSFNLNAAAKGKQIKAIKSTWKAKEDIVIINTKTGDIISKWQLKHYMNKAEQDKVFQREDYKNFKKCGIHENINFDIKNKLEEDGVSSEPIIEYQKMTKLAEDIKKPKVYKNNEIEKFLNVQEKKKNKENIKKEPEKGQLNNKNDKVMMKFENNQKEKECICNNGPLEAISSLFEENSAKELGFF